MKLLVAANKQDLVSLLLPGAKFEREFNNEMQSCVLEADLLYVVKWQADHTPLDMWLLDEAGKPAKPYLTDKEAVAIILRITRGNIRLLERLMMRWSIC